jgi:hypothetical protein
MSNHVLTRCLQLCAGGPLLAAVLVCQADTTDLTEYLYGVTDQVRCAGTPNSSVAVYADVDGNGSNDTLVVFTSLQGAASAHYSPGFGYGNYLYFFTGSRSPCGGTTGGVGRLGIRFVDMQAPGFNVANPATWTYKGVPGVQLVVASDLCNVSGSDSPYRQVSAYTQTNAGGTLLRLFSTGTYPDFSTQVQSCDFNSPAGVKEIQVRTDFCENDIRYFVIHSSASSGGADAGLRVYDGATVTRIACEIPGPDGALLSSARFTKNGTNYGIILTDIDSPSASKIRVQTSSGTKAWTKLP